MKAAIYNPYLDTLGGGERYTMAFALVMAEKDFRVDVEWKDENIKVRLEKRFNMDLSKINFVQDIKKGDGYDVCFWVSDGSIPLLHARVNLLHFQFPFTNINGKTLLNKMKLFRINKVICNSIFTKSFIDKEFGIKSTVVYPPVSVEQFKPKRKENLILYVGRFSTLTQAKRQDILIKAFKKFYINSNDWELVIAGGSEVGVGDYVKSLRDQAEGYPIRIMESPSFSQITELYGKAKLFWSAAGYGIDENKEPTHVEHFGITVVEAMAAGCVPLVFNAGGHKEIIKEGNNGYLWKSIGELLKKTEMLEDDKKLFRETSINAKAGSENYVFEKFKKSFFNILSTT
ncbi:hypothetical protein A2V55_02300 [Candidatus Woesebacteria bacterium RBG_19FT_COMBO_37_29]|uniref:Glycosyl transferase family 1 domain-containing protein n=1 Tax=Candidatus Woesebacteria bacterium RBG_19FT_COMBO_37_29 TaxID=1802486 RepID=A0A1F7XMC7_9BACT|nr:MAG: hypothetical protein A2V55_02300 [Candidatus Woesebacteria bacterium RBG_19FT_COMBO_37_29]